MSEHTHSNTWAAGLLCTESLRPPTFTLHQLIPTTWAQGYCVLPIPRLKSRVPDPQHGGGIRKGTSAPYTDADPINSESPTSRPQVEVVVTSKPKTVDEAQIAASQPAPARLVRWSQPGSQRPHSTVVGLQPNARSHIFASSLMRTCISICRSLQPTAALHKTANYIHASYVCTF